MKKNTDLVQLFRQIENYFFSGISQETIDMQGAAKIYFTAVPSQYLNFIYVYKTDYLNEILRQAKDFFDSVQHRFIVLIPQEYYSTRAEKILEENKYSHCDTSAAMCMHLDEKNKIFQINHLNEKDNSVTNHDITIKENQFLNNWAIPLTKAFESTPDITSIYADTHLKALNKGYNFKHYCLYKNNQPVSAITFSLYQNTARIDDVGTLPEFQHHGYATLLIKYILNEIKKFGAKYCFLEASNDGLSIYQKCGFEILFRNNIYCLKNEAKNSEHLF